MTNVEKAKQALSNTRVRPVTPQVAEVRQNINMIHEALKSIMKDGTHFGVIPGCGKPSLYKPGAEVIIALFKLSTDPVVTNMSENGEIRYQVKVNITTRDGVFVGSGIGECSSGEEKYMWRAAICDKEFESTPETMRRIKFSPEKVKGYKTGNILEIQQVRVSPSDLANTILKMAKKRALIDGVLTSTAASDIFTQDIQDLPDGYLPPDEATDVKGQEVGKETKQPEKPPPSEESQGKPAKKTDNPISDPQRKRFYAISKGVGMSDQDITEFLMFNYNLESSKDIDRAQYEDICNHVQEWGKK